MRKILLLALPAVAMAFGPAMPLASTPVLARAGSCRAAPALRMAVADVGSESELDAAIAGAGDPSALAAHPPHTAYRVCVVVGRAAPAARDSCASLLFSAAAIFFHRHAF